MAEKSTQVEAFPTADGKRSTVNMVKLAFGAKVVSGMLSAFQRNTQKAGSYDKDELLHTVVMVEEWLKEAKEHV